MTKDNGYERRNGTQSRESAGLVESFIESKDPQKKQDLQDFAEGLCDSIRYDRSTAPVYKKLEDIRKRDRYKENKMAELRRRVAERTNKMLSKLKMFGKGSRD